MFKFINIILLIYINIFSIDNQNIRPSTNIYTNNSNSINIKESVSKIAQKSINNIRDVVDKYFKYLDRNNSRRTINEIDGFNCVEYSFALYLIYYHTLCFCPDDNVDHIKFRYVFNHLYDLIIEYIGDNNKNELADMFLFGLIHFFKINYLTNNPYDYDLSNDDLSNDDTLDYDNSIQELLINHIVNHFRYLLYKNDTVHIV